MLLALTAFVQTWSEAGSIIIAYKNPKAGDYIRETVVPKMMVMCLGWALGSAFKATQNTIEQTYLWG